jgi:hypothetical protein
MNEKIAKIVATYLEQFTDTKFLSAPSIPPKKLKNAIKAYALDASESEALLFLDTTIFGNAKDGLLLTGDTLYAHLPFGKPVKIAFKDIQTIKLEETEYASMDVRINDPRSPGVADIKEQDARLFAQMLKDVKAVLVPDSEVVVSEVSRISHICQPRLVPVEGGKLRRYKFINLHQRGSEMGKIVNEHAGLISPKVVFQGDDAKVYAVTDSKNVFINGEPFSGKRQLADGDLIGLGKDEKMELYQFQANAVTHKQRRLEQESALGLKRYEGEEKPTQVVNRKFIIDAKGVTLKDDSVETRLSWADVDLIAFSADYDFLYKATNNLGNAAGQGVALGSATATAFLESRRLSDVWAIFPAPNYKVEFSGEKLEGVDQRACAMLDKGIELFAPMDLVTFK